MIHKTILLDKKDEPVLEVRSVFIGNSDQNVPLSYVDSFPIIRAIKESEYLITSENDIYSFLHYTRFKTFGLFRLNFGFTSLGNAETTQVNEDEIYLIVLVPVESTLNMCYLCETNQEIVS
ncbi:MAG: hypothetical protein WBL67_14540 [Nitrososphaeraceae archaeon]